jgi:triosephosphate isomerase
MLPATLDSAVRTAKSSGMNRGLKLIVANWKMNELREEGESLALAVANRSQEFEADIVICPPFTLLNVVAQDLAGSKVNLGAQDCHPEEKGAFTGDISARMLCDVGASYVIVGHSERRAHYGEANDFVARKAHAALEAGLIPIICVGETMAIRESGMAESYVGTQLRESLPDLKPGQVIVVGYEPVWAIGTGKSCSYNDITSMHTTLRGTLAAVDGSLNATRIIYGGSVKAGNAAEILALPDVDGALVGGASLDATSFLAIIAAAKNAVGQLVRTSYNSAS